jgi:hypothetical protein
MKCLNHIFVATLFILVVAVPPSRAQTNTQKAERKTAAPAQSEEQKNLRAYIDLLRGNVRQQKAEIMGSVMLLSAQDATKFWPIYSKYDRQLTKLNDQRVENIKEYAGAYDQMTDEKADELIQKALAYQKQRAELVAQTYEKINQALGE